MGPIGFREPFCESATKHKVNVHLDPNFGATGSGTGDADPAMWISPVFSAGGAENMTYLAHELAHSMQFNTQVFRSNDAMNAVGWVWESHAQFMAYSLPLTHDFPVPDVSRSINAAHLGFGHESTRYVGFYFWEYLADRYCYQAVDTLWTTAKQMADAGNPPQDVMSALMQSRQWTVAQLNDFVGEFAMHTVAMDLRDLNGNDRGPFWRSVIGPRTDRFNNGGDNWLRDVRLDAQDLQQRRFSVPMGWALQPHGFNVVRLVPDAGASSVTVDFRGIAQSAAPKGHYGNAAAHEPAVIPNPDSNWRWGLVATDAQGAGERPEKFIITSHL